MSTDPNRSQPSNHPSKQLPPRAQREYFAVSGSPFKLEHSQSAREYCAAAGSPLRPSWHTQSLPRNYTHNDYQPSTGPSFGHDHSPILNYPEHHSGPRPHNAASTSSKYLPTGKLIVKVFKARKIKGDEWGYFGKADPYGEIKFGGQNVPGGEVRAKTSVQKDAGSQPEWNQTFTFYVRMTDHAEYNNLSITLYNENRCDPLPRADNILGELM